MIYISASTANQSTSAAAKILQRFGPDPDPDSEYADCGFWENACNGMLQQEKRWKQSGEVFSWIDERPAWMSAADWNLRILPPQKPCARRFRLSLIGGGQIRVTENLVLFSPGDELPPIIICDEQPMLRVQAETNGGLRTCSGVLSHGFMCEMQTYAVVFPRGTPQEIADRTAATLRLIDSTQENLVALLARGDRCGCCRRPLEDEVSKLLGIGPDCAKALRVPHTIAFANRVL
jgi:uncharacterized protein DUF6011